MMGASDTGIGGSVFPRPPYQFEDVTSVTFRLHPGSGSDLQGICDEYLNDTLGLTSADSGCFRVPEGHPLLLLTFSNFPRVVSNHGALTRYLRYQEVSLTFSVDEYYGNSRRPRRSLFAPVLFLDGPAMMPLHQDGQSESSHGDGFVSMTGHVGDWQTGFPIAVGRELFGLPKTRAEIRFDFGAFAGPSPRPQQGGERYTVSTATIQPGQADVEPMRLKEFITLEVAPGKSWTGGARGDPNEASMEGEQSYVYERPILGLRRIHDPSNVGNVVHQDVVSSTFKFDKFPRKYTQGFEIRFDLDAFPELDERLVLEESYIVDGYDIDWLSGATALYGDKTECFSPGSQDQA